MIITSEILETLSTNDLLMYINNTLVMMLYSFLMITLMKSVIRNLRRGRNHGEFK